MTFDTPVKKVPIHLQVNEYTIKNNMSFSKCLYLKRLIISIYYFIDHCYLFEIIDLIIWSIIDLKYINS